jgi:folylpolyglutamate synthase/dihydropteroate synthase
VWATQARDNPRALDAAELGRRARLAQVEPNLEQALHAATAAAACDGGVVCVTGSLLLVGQARTALGLPVANRLW